MFGGQPFQCVNIDRERDKKKWCDRL